VAELEPMRDHWWWRPGWEVGRSFYTLHITFADQPEAHALVKHYAPVLGQLPMLDPVPVKWLHLTLQGIGFTDEVSRGDVDQIVEAARTRCAALKPFTLTIGPAHLDPETIQMPSRPLGPVAELRLAIRAAIGDVWGVENVPERQDGFRAHVSLGYSNSANRAQPGPEDLRVGRHRGGPARRVGAKSFVDDGVSAGRPQFLPRTGQPGRTQWTVQRRAEALRSVLVH
jgi:2'-5' RNA ligase